MRQTLLALLVAASCVSAALYSDPAHLPSNEYDFVVVGAGAAGNVIASRLTENAKFSVLVIEAGISHEGIVSVEVPFLAPSNLPNSSVTWNYSTTPQVGLNNRVLTYPRGRILGGSSSINFMTYTRGSNAEYDRWARITGDSSWSWEKLSPYYLKSSRLVSPVDNRSTVGEINPAVHGFGPVEISLQSPLTELDPLLYQTCALNGSEFPLNIDIQSGNSVGVGLVQSTIGGGARSSSATAYLEPALNRKNLDVLIENTVTRLVQSGSTGGIPAFNKVEFASSPTAPRTVVTARKEVILSAGSIGTPQILMLSGIGDSNELRALNITPVVDIPDVGQHLQDHPIMPSYWSVNTNSTWDNVLRDPDLAAADLSQWMKNRTGLFSNAPADGVAFLRIPDDSPIFKTTPDPSPGAGSGHYEMIFINGFVGGVVPQPATGNFLSINIAVVTPTSTGSLRLPSSDPFASPLINPNYFNTTFDQFAMLTAVKAARAFVATKPWQGFIDSPFGPLGEASSDDEIIAASREVIVSIWHPTSTARMSPKNASWGVVDPELLVKGVHGLRIVDASVFPVIPSAHTVGPVYILAERAADIIKAAWS